MRATGLSEPGSPAASPVPDGPAPPWPSAGASAPPSRGCLSTPGSAAGEGRGVSRWRPRPRPHGSRLPGTTAGGRLGRHPPSRGMRHLSREGRRRREVRESAQTPLLLQQEAASVLPGIALGAEEVARVGHLALPRLATPQVGPRQDPKGSPPEAALLGSVLAKPAVPLLEGDDECRPHVHLL